MRIAFISDVLTIHQIPFCNEMHNKLGDKFCFISTKQISDERKKQGWQTSQSFPYEIKATSDKGNEIMTIVNESDILIVGMASDQYMINRLKNGKVTFKYTERLYKNKLSLKSFPRAVVSSYIHHGRFQKYPLYLLCAGAHVANDMLIFNNYKNKMFKWGYFPETPGEFIDKADKDCVNILWTGRFLDCKRPELIVKAAGALHDESLDFHITLIGEGPQKSVCENMTKEMKLQNVITFLPFQPYEKIHKYMKESIIYVFPSNRYEGWGAVVNEAMGNGCIVVGSRSAGSVPYLIKDGINGYSFEENDFDAMCAVLRSLITNKELRVQMSKNAQEIINKLWNSRIAAERLIKISEALVNKTEIPKYEDGPCSRA